MRPHRLYFCLKLGNLLKILTGVVPFLALFYVSPVFSAVSPERCSKDLSPNPGSVNRPTVNQTENSEYSQLAQRLDQLIAKLPSGLSETQVSELKEILRVQKIYGAHKPKNNSQLEKAVVKISLTSMQALVRFLETATIEDFDYQILRFEALNNFVRNLGIYYLHITIFFELANDETNLFLFQLIGFNTLGYTMFHESYSFADFLYSSFAYFGSRGGRVDIADSLRMMANLRLGKLSYPKGSKDLEQRLSSDFEVFVQSQKKTESSESRIHSQLKKYANEIPDLEKYLETYGGLFDQSTVSDLLGKLESLKWFQESSNEVKVKNFLLLSYALKKGEITHQRNQRDLLLNSVNYILSGGVGVSFEELKDGCGGYFSRRGGKIGFSEDLSIQNLDWNISVLAHEVSHALSPYNREDSVTYYLEELRAYQIGFLALNGRFMFEYEFLDWAKELFSHKLYPDMLRAWKHNPREYLPRNWREVNRHADPSLKIGPYPTSFDEMLIYLGFKKESVLKFERTQDSQFLVGQGNRNTMLYAPFITRSGSLVFPEKNSGLFGPQSGNDWQAVLNMPYEGSK